MGFFRRRRAEEKTEEKPEETAPPPPPPPEETKPSQTPLAAAINKFLEENPGEIDLAWYAEMEKMPYLPPVIKFLEWAREKGYGDYPPDEARRELFRIIDSRIRAKGVRGMG